MTREDGFYWVRYLGKWALGDWSYGCWSVTGTWCEDLTDEDFDEIGPRIYPPDQPEESLKQAVGAVIAQKTTIYGIPPADFVAMGREDGKGMK